MLMQDLRRRHHTETLAAGPSKEELTHLARRGQKSRGWGAQGIQYLVSLQWPVVQLDFSDGMHMTENSDMPQSARMRAQIQANTGKYKQFWTPEIQSASRAINQGTVVRILCNALACEHARVAAFL